MAGILLSLIVIYADVAEAARRSRTRTARSTANGLCTSANTGSVQVRRGYCDLLYRTLADNPCHQRLIDQIVRHSRGDARRISGMSNFCPTFGALTRDRVSKTMVFQNLLAALVTEESSWDPSTRGDGGRSKGHFQISVGSARQRAYNCACSRVTNSNIRDPRINIPCGSYIALYNMARDMAVGHGPAGYAGSRGAARYFGPFGDDQAHKRRRMAAKTNSFCVARAEALHQQGPSGQPGTAIAERRPPSHAPVQIATADIGPSWSSESVPTPPRRPPTAPARREGTSSFSEMGLIIFTPGSD